MSDPMDSGASAYAAPPPPDPFDWPPAPVAPLIPMDLKPEYPTALFIAAMRRGQPGQWREEWAAVVRWSDALAWIERMSSDYRDQADLHVGRDAHTAGALYNGKASGLEMAARRIAGVMEKAG